jgi:hypothetical protein
VAESASWKHKVAVGASQYANNPPYNQFESFPQGRRENIARLRIQMAAKGVNGYEIEWRRQNQAPPLNLPDVFLTTETISARPSL